MDRDQVLDTITKHIRLNADGLEDVPIDPAKSMKDYGLSSLDIVEVLSASMRELRIRVPRTEMANLSNVSELVDLFLLVAQGR